jgi:hypothetical protein
MPRTVFRLIRSGGSSAAHVEGLKSKAPSADKGGVMTRPHQYVECDVPEGMTLSDYRATKREPARTKRSIMARLRARRARRTGEPARAAA